MRQSFSRDDMRFLSNTNLTFCNKLFQCSTKTIVPPPVVILSQRIELAAEVCGELRSVI